MPTSREDIRAKIYKLAQEQLKQMAADSHAHPPIQKDILQRWVVDLKQRPEVRKLMDLSLEGKGEPEPILSIIRQMQPDINERHQTEIFMELIRHVVSERARASKTSPGARGAGSKQNLADLLEHARCKRNGIAIRELYDAGLQFAATHETSRLGWPDFTDQADPERSFDVALVVAYLDYAPVPVLEGDSWLAIEHQCAGTLCAHVSMVALQLAPHPEVREALVAIAKRWWNTALGNGLSLTQANEYRGALLRLGVDCDRSWHHLMEAFYPIDLTHESLQRLAVDPPNADTLAQGLYVRPMIVCLAPNSD